MLKYVFLCLAVLLIPITEMFAADTKDTPPTIAWEKTLESAVTKAKAEGKPILLDFFAPT